MSSGAQIIPTLKTMRIIVIIYTVFYTYLINNDVYVLSMFMNCAVAYTNDHIIWDVVFYE